MIFVQDHPRLLLLCALAVLFLAVRLGVILHEKRGDLASEERDDYSLMVASSLTLLALIIGFTFSMSIGRYDQRKNYEEAEANAIGTEYLRSELLPAADAARVRDLLRKYLDQRMLFYKTGDPQELQRINAATSNLQSELWSAVRMPAESRQTALVALAVSGMNDVLNSQGYTQAAWRNRIPSTAWILLVFISVCCNFLIGYVLNRNQSSRASLLVVLPVLFSVSFFLIADIDSPYSGVIRVQPENLLSVAESLRAH